MNLVSFYDIKLGCENCGMADFYKIPRGQEFLAFQFKDDANEPEHVISRTRLGFDEEDKDTKPLDCYNCHMPCLVLVGWEKKDLPIRKPIDAKKQSN